LARQTTLPSALRRVKEFRSLNDPDRAGANAAIERGVVAAIGSIGAATLASRVLGYARDIVVARAFGAGPVTDAFFVAFRIPNLLRRLLAEGALSTGVVPVLSATLGNSGPSAGTVSAKIAIARRIAAAIARGSACSGPSTS